MNQVTGNYEDQSHEAITYRNDMVKMLDVYETEFDAYFEKNPKATESQAHNHGLYMAKLTEAGLCTARAYAGKKASMKPGVFIKIADYKPTI